MSDETVKTGLQNRLCMVAATCFSTFDVCPEHGPATMINEEDISIAIQCAVIVHDYTPQSPLGDSSVYFGRMLRRHHRLLHDLERLFSQSSVHRPATLLHAGAFDHALERVWLGYRQVDTSGWHVLRKKNPRWLSCMTDQGQEVHYDTLTGELLISGKSLGKLPQQMVEDPIYKSIFGTVSGQRQISSPFGPYPRCFQRNFDVVPADIPGMDYMTRSTPFGYQVRYSSCRASVGD